MIQLLPTKLISLFLAFILIAGTITTVSVYGQQQSKSPFVTRSELETALDNLVTQDQLQDTEDEFQSSLAQLQLRQDQLQAALDNLVTQDQLQDTEDELQSSLAQLQTSLASTQAQLQSTQNQLQSALANLVTQEDLDAALADIINSENLYSRDGVIASTGNTLGTIFSVARCDSGDILLEGGYDINNFGGGPIIAFGSGSPPTGDAFITEVRATGISLQSHALCLDIP